MTDTILPSTEVSDEQKEILLNERRSFKHEKYDEAQKSLLKYRFDFTKNKKQKEFYKVYSDALLDKNRFRYLFYGGAVRGGKTTICVLCVLVYARRYPGSMSYIIRRSEPVLKNTTMVTFKDMVSSKSVKRWSYKTGEMFCELKNGSKIFFLSESGNHDKDLNKFKGLEANLFFLEQLEELRRETFDKCIERLATYRTKERIVPPGIILATFNPTLGWLKEDIYEKWASGDLKAPYYYLTALPTDNPFIGTEKYDQWADLDPISYERFILGSWEARDKSNLFAYCFDSKKHVADLTLQPLPIWLSFDFNVSPMTCIMCQHSKDGNVIHILKEFRMENTGIEEFCQWVKKQIPENFPIFVTGDPAGQARNALARANLTYYKVIADVLHIPKERVKVSNVAPTHENSWVFCNQLFHKNPGFKVDKSCKKLIEDLVHVKMTAEGKLDKKQTLRPGEPSIGHLLDCLRYYLHVNFYKTIL